MRTQSIAIEITSGVEYTDGSSEYYFNATNYDPQLSLNCGSVEGWVQIQFSASTEDDRIFKLYMDRGFGYSEEDSIILSYISSKSLKIYTILVNIGNSIKSLRLDPGDISGEFSIIDFTIKEVSRLRVLVRSIKNYIHHCDSNYLDLLVKSIDYGVKNGIRALWNKSKIFLNINNSQVDNQYVLYEHKNINWDYKKMDIEVQLSVIINDCKDKELLNKTVESLKNQDYTNVEILCVCSTDNGIDNIENYSSIEEACKEVSSNYIITLNCGDILAEKTLHLINHVIQEFSPNLIFSDEDRINLYDEHYEPFYKSKYKDNLTPNIIGDFFVIKKDILIKNNYKIKTSIYNSIKNKELVFNIAKVLYSKRLIENKKVKSAIKPIAFYLPQFHPIPENDEWWGKGFTEWVNTKRAVPMFNGHYQPHIPERLGYYDLLEDEDIQMKQIELAKEYGIYGFCYYYYWFEGKKLLEKPLEKFLDNKNLDFPFCLCWANETWSRRWDGQDKEILIKQVHNEKTDEAFIYDIIPIMKDNRYIRLNNKPILLIYRAELFPNLKNTIKRWNRICMEEGLGKIEVIIVQTFGITAPKVYGAHYAVEFPPHGVVATKINSQIDSLRKDFEGNIYDYREVVDRCLLKEDQQYTLFRGCMLNWDNTARRMTSSNIFKGANPKEYSKWLNGICDYTYRFNHEDEQFIFINAWNEWAEGTHLEPDEKYGTQYLEETSSVISNYVEKSEKNKEPVSIIIPSYNYDKYIIEAIDSVYSQTYDNIELIIVDDASSDNSVNVIRDYIDREIVKNRFTRILFVDRKENKGAHYTINEGVRIAEGKWIAILNADDVFEPNRIKNMMKELKDRGGLIAFSKVLTINSKGEVCLSEEGVKFNNIQKSIDRYKYVHMSLIPQNVAISTGNMLFAKELYDKVGGFMDYKYCHDWDFILKACLITEPLFIKSTNYYYRLHDMNSFRTLQDVADKEVESILFGFLEELQRNKQENKNICYNDIIKIMKGNGLDRFIKRN